MTASSIPTSDGPRFQLGWLVAATPGALAALNRAKSHPFALLARHMRGDWGELGDEDWALNEIALRTEMRLLSSYTLETGERVWVITEADRSITTVLLPEEY
ncbi:hypothetical protein ACU4HD_19595 [Cupriavidus basilensis]